MTISRLRTRRSRKSHKARSKTVFNISSCATNSPYSLLVDGSSNSNSNVRKRDFGQIYDDQDKPLHSPVRKKPRRITQFFASISPSSMPARKPTISSGTTPSFKRMSFRKKRLVSSTNKEAGPSTPSSRLVPKQVKLSAENTLSKFVNKAMAALSSFGSANVDEINLKVEDIKQEEVDCYVSGRQLLKKEMPIIKDLDSVILLMLAKEKAASAPQDVLITTVFVKKFAADNEDDCIKRDPTDKKWPCCTCVTNFDEDVYLRLKGAGGYLATHGDVKYRAARTYGHLVGAMHRTLKARGNADRSSGSVPMLFNSNRHSKELFLIKIVLTVYVTIKRQGASANFCHHQATRSPSCSGASRAWLRTTTSWRAPRSSLGNRSRRMLSITTQHILTTSGTSWRSASTTSTSRPRSRPRALRTTSSTATTTSRRGTTTS